MRRTTIIVAPLLAWALWAALTLPPSARVARRATRRGMAHRARRVPRALTRLGRHRHTRGDRPRGGRPPASSSSSSRTTATRPRTPAPPRYVAGVLCIAAVEISTADGHYAALGLAPPPYPLAGEGRDVAEDVARLGGFGIAAHPDSAKATLRWRAWDAAVDGVEWFNADSQWRDESRWRLLPALLQYPLRPAETVVSLFDRPVDALAQWDGLTATRRVVGLAAADAHARLGFKGKADPYDESLYIPVPSYEAVFRAFSIRAELDTPLSGDAARDAELVLGAIRNGRIYTVFDGLAGPAVLDFTAASSARRVRQGGWLAGEGIQFHGTANVPTGGTLVLLRDGEEVARTNGPALTHASDRPGAYRLEARLPGAPGAPALPWIVSNPIYLGPGYAGTAASRAETPASADPPWHAGAWHVERDAASTGEFQSSDTADGAASAFTFTLAATAVSPFVALVTNDAGGVREATRFSFRAHASRPVRISVQARCDDGSAAAQRWVRSVYLDQTPREVTVAFADMRVAGTRRARHSRRAASRRSCSSSTRPTRAPATAGASGLSGCAAAVSLPPSSGADGEQEIRGGRREQDVGRPRGQQRRDDAARPDGREHAHRRPVDDARARCRGRSRTSRRAVPS